MSRANGRSPRTGFEHVEAWVFDLDNTLYPAECNLFAEIDTRMGEFISERFGVSFEEAQRIRKAYYYEYGTTLAGLMRLHDVCPKSFLDYVHDIDLSAIQPAPELAAALDALAGRKFILTNGSSEHAERVVARLGLGGHFEAIFDIRSADFVPKPEAACYERFMTAHRVKAQEAAMFDDLPHNLETAHGLGMTTVLVACGPIDHPEHHAIAGWSELPPHIHHKTDALASFLTDIGAQMGRRSELSAPPLWGRDREVGLPGGSESPPSTPPSAEPAPPQRGSGEQVATVCQAFQD